MLEFQEGFFDQEVRDGFYLDTTMKTLWAAELEVLQKVAEVCDRHGLKWYAAYGTLLGAIRHEGFVPWDDDMDIWVKRPDYNILMQVLPQELPEGYLVRGPLTDEGYDQFHTCLNSGSGISIAKEWLDQFHGCPFTVGLDIFPLDYLPRNEKDRELQVNLLSMTGRIAQLAKLVGRGDFDPKDGESEQKSSKSAKKNKKGRKKKGKTRKDDVIEEINLGISYLEKNCKLQIDHQLLKDEKWEKVSSELWKWANYLAMMYGEEEGDYLVEFFDYIQCPHKVYPKEWFADGYSATFENFMIPVPAGYDEILRYIYGLEGTYLKRKKKTGTHEYPFYARQLRQLREYVKDIQQRAQDVGLVSIDQIEVKEETKELLPEWVPLTLKKDGSQKKIVLSANDPSVYAMYGHKALDKLEETLKIFECVKDSVLLWWRPQPVMKKILDQTSAGLGERYQEILDRYKESGWGICDETDNIDRAVEVCDIYYGDMNAVLQPFQNAGKPVMISSVADNGEACKINAERINEYRIFLNFADFVEDEKHIYFVNTNYNALVVADKETGTIVKHIPLEGYQADRPNMHLRCMRQQNRILFLPAGASDLYIYDMESGKQETCDFLGQTGKEILIQDLWGWNCFQREDQVYLLPFWASQGLWSLTSQDSTPVKENWWSVASEDEIVFEHGTMDQDRFYTLVSNSCHLHITNTVDRTVEDILLPDENVHHITYDGYNFWYVLRGTPGIVCWNTEQGVVDRYMIPCDPYYIFGVRYGLDTYLGICCAGGHLFLLSGEGKYLYVLDQNARELRTLHTFQCARGAFTVGEMRPYFKRTGNSLICTQHNTGEMLLIDLETLNVRQVREIFHAEGSLKEDIYKYGYKILLKRSALLLEEEGLADLNLVIQYCTEE